MELNKEILTKYEEEGWIRSQSHPTLPLMILNYTQKTQYESHWDEITLNCRGLIVDENYNPVVRPFGKFFNYEEIVDKDLIPTKGDYVYVQEKMDGSFGILFNYEGEWIMATRGSFTSDQALKGLEIVKSKYNLDSWFREYAYLVEIIYPDNRVVVDYQGKEKIVFLSVVLNEMYNWNSALDAELHWTTACSILFAIGIRKEDIVKTEQHFNFSTDLYKSLKEKNENNKEGFVLRYQPGNFRMKIKFEEYVRLHKIVTGVSTTDIWERLKDKSSFDELLEKVPDEFHLWVKETVRDLVVRFENIERDYQRYFEDISYIENRKDFAEAAKRFEHPSILFNMKDGKAYDAHIWKMIKPKYKKAFSTDTE